jgi:hypothetical protein
LLDVKVPFFVIEAGGGESSVEIRLGSNSVVELQLIEGINDERRTTRPGWVGSVIAIVEIIRYLPKGRYSAKDSNQAAENRMENNCSFQGL